MLVHLMGTLGDLRVQIKGSSATASGIRHLTDHGDLHPIIVHDHARDHGVGLSGLTLAGSTEGWIAGVIDDAVEWWAMQDSNLRPTACKADALTN